jgi:hypothetical protein
MEGPSHKRWPSARRAWAVLTGEPIDKPWPFARRAWAVLFFAFLVCWSASLLVEAHGPASSLRWGLTIAALVFLIAGAVFYVRWRKNQLPK